MKVKARTLWRSRKDRKEEVKVSRVNKNEVFFHSSAGGGAEQRMSRNTFLAEYSPSDS